jgi:hypothetical protein
VHGGFRAFFHHAPTIFTPLALFFLFTAFKIKVKALYLIRVIDFDHD